MSERFFIRCTPEVRRQLLHLAVDLDAAAEKLAGILLAEALRRADTDALRKIVPKKRER